MASRLMKLLGALLPDIRACSYTVMRQTFNDGKWDVIQWNERLSDNTILYDTIYYIYLYQINIDVEPTLEGLLFN